MNIDWCDEINFLPVSQNAKPRNEGCINEPARDSGGRNAPDYRHEVLSRISIIERVEFQHHFALPDEHALVAEEEFSQPLCLLGFPLPAFLNFLCCHSLRLV